PVAMKLLTVMRYVLVGFCTTPPLTMTSVGPVTTGGATVTSVGVKLASMTFEHAGALALHEYFRPLDDCITRLAVWPRQPLNCSSSRFLSCAAVTVIVTRLLPNGWTVKASPYVSAYGYTFVAVMKPGLRTPPAFMKAICAP